MERKKQNGLLELLSAVIISRVKMARASISVYLSSRRIARLLTLTMMCALSSMSVGALLLGSPCLSSSAAVDFSKPYNIVPNSIRTIPLSSQFTTENDWRQYSRIIYHDDDAIGLSYRITASAADNYGENFMIWLSVYVYGGDRDGRILYNSGWQEGIINEDSFNNQSRDDIRVIMRVKYKDDSGHYNPPVNNQWSGASFTITFDKYQNWSDIPQEWKVTTTASTMDIPTPVFTTTTYIDWDGQVTGNNGIFQTLRYSISTIFGIGDSWESAVYVMNYINGKLPYVFAISAFCGVCGIAVWFLEK